MASKKKGQFTVSVEWAKHLRPYWRRIFWKKERKAAKRQIVKELFQKSSANKHI